MFKERLSPMQRSSAKKKSKAFWVSFLAVFLLLSFIIGAGATSPVLAQNSNINSNLTAFGTASGLPNVDLVTFVGNLVRIFLGMIGVVLVLIIIYAGWIWMTAEGDPTKVDKAKKIITNAIIGLIIMMLSFAIATFIMGWLGGKGNNPNPPPSCPGCHDDPWRSNIGRGPIESVYPAPQQKDVSIDTLIIVTFKEPVASSTIYKDNGYIRTSTIHICEASSTGGCMSGSDFNVDHFASTTVSSTADNRTYVFTPNSNLGPADGKDRYFQVWLGPEITKLGKTESVFGGGEYSWSFETNGKLDLNPPYVVASEIIPPPDDHADDYNTVSVKATGVVTSLFGSAVIPNVPVKIWDRGGSFHFYVDKSHPLIAEMTPATAVEGGFKAYVRSPSGFAVASDTPASTTIDFTVSPDGTYVTFNNNNNAKDYLGVTYKIDGVCKDGSIVRSSCLPLSVSSNSLDLNGLIAESRTTADGNSNIPGTGAPFPRSSRWSFTVYSPVIGDRYIIQNGAIEQKYMFVSDNEAIPRDIPSYITVKAGTSAISSTQYLATAINSNSLIVNAEATTTPNTSVIIRAKEVGEQGNSIRIVRWTGNASTTESVTGGTNTVYGVIRNDSTPDPQDSPNNTKFQITFSKAINPLSITNNIIVRMDKNGDGIVSSIETTTASTTFSNQYRTVDLIGTIPCGKNSCGDTIYCWSTSTPGAFPTSTKFEVEIKAATLKTCVGTSDSWCVNGDKEVAGSFGGGCSADTKCSKLVNGQTVYYPKTADYTSGIADMSNNSFNGNYNYYYDDNEFYKQNLGIADGPGSNPFLLPILSSANIASWPELAGLAKGPWSTSVATTGDNFQWSFYVSSLIDSQSPLISKIEPYGDQKYGSDEGQTPMDQVKITFDRIMAADTLKPGWGYDPAGDRTTASWAQRFVALQTITPGANPVGYWVGSSNISGETNGWAEQTQAVINHNNFDQSVQYGPLVGSGVQSITQNCFLPGNGPRYAGDEAFASTMGATSSNNCNYQKNGSNETQGCMTDASSSVIYNVSSTNPASYAHENCLEVEGAKICSPTDRCAVIYYNASVSSTHKYGSWIITKDHPTSTLTGDISGSTGCCFGTCVVTGTPLSMSSN